MAENNMRNFRNIGTNLFKILTKLAGNKELCRLLTYPMPDIYNQALPTDSECLQLINKNLLLVPKIPDITTDKGSFVVILFEDMELNEENNEFLLSKITFDILCPLTDWIVEAESLRPFLIMAEINEMFNGKKLNNVGVLKLFTAERFTLTPDLGGYTMTFLNNEFA